MVKSCFKDGIKYSCFDPAKCTCSESKILSNFCSNRPLVATGMNVVVFFSDTVVKLVWDELFVDSGMSGYVKNI